MRSIKKVCLFCAAVLWIQPLPGQEAQEGNEPARFKPADPSALPFPIGGSIPSEEHLELRKPITLTVEGGRQFQGTLASIDGDRIGIRIVQEGGEVVLSFPLNEISGLFFPGERIVNEAKEMIEAQELEKALPYLESIIGARYILLPLLPPEDKSFYTHLPEAALAVDNPAQAIAYVKALRPYLPLESDQIALDEVELIGYHAMELTDEARERAQKRIAGTNRYGESALGFYVLSSILFEEGAYDPALYTALEPIVFSGDIPVPYLSECYSLAIAISHLMGDERYRDILIAEMEERGLSWQPLEAFRGAQKDLADLLLTDDSGSPLPLYPGITP